MSSCVQQVLVICWSCKEHNAGVSSEIDSQHTSPLGQNPAADNVNPCSVHSHMSEQLRVQPAALVHWKGKQSRW